jgi:hypothetical protein
MLRSIVLVASLVSCVKTTAFQCEGDRSLCSGTGARCEADGFCSIPAASCASGFQYSDTAGDLAGTCVGGDPTPDGPTSDGPISDGPADCGADFAPLTGGNAGHTYKVLASADGIAQQAACVTSGAYLAIPDDATELGAVVGLAGDVDIWIGVNDRTTEGEYREVLANTIYTALPIEDGTGNQTNQDCVGSKDGTTLETDNCDGSRVAVCECN